MFFEFSAFWLKQANKIQYLPSLTDITASMDVKSQTLYDYFCPPSFGLCV